MSWLLERLAVPVSKCQSSSSIYQKSRHSNMIRFVFFTSNLCLIRRNKIKITGLTNCMHHCRTVLGPCPDFANSSEVIHWVSILYTSAINMLKSYQNIWIYESNVFLTVKKSTSDGTNWKNQVTKLHRVAKPWDEIITNTGQLTSEQNIDVSTIM